MSNGLEMQVTKLRTRTVKMSATRIHLSGMDTALGTLEGDNFELRCDPRLLRLTDATVKHAVIVYVVALH